MNQFSTPLFAGALVAALTAMLPPRADAAVVAESINGFGLDLHRRLAASGGNLVTSPWSIESALAMTYAGASGPTKAEMARVLHFGDDESAVHEGLAGLSADLRAMAERSRERVKSGKKLGGPSTPLEITVANRLFGRGGSARSSTRRSSPWINTGPKPLPRPPWSCRAPSGPRSSRRNRWRCASTVPLPLPSSTPPPGPASSSAV